MDARCVAQRLVGASSSSSTSAVVGKRKIRDEDHVTPVGGSGQHLLSPQIQMPDVEALPLPDRRILAAIQALGHYPNDLRGKACVL